MPELLIGPLLRYVGERCAVIWVETDGPCEVGVMSACERTFHVEGHHYALVRVEDLEPGASHEYTVELDGRPVWPPPDSEFPPSRFRTYPKREPLTVSFGSCRVAVPNEPPYSLAKEEDEHGRGVDALRALALRMRGQDPDDWPDLLLLLGDQVYADEVSPRTEAFVRSNRDTSEEPGTIAFGFQEYTRLYKESWTEPTIRWLLSTVSTAMIFDDHDVHDDWNTSAAWVEEVRATDWWDAHVVAALMSYWIYQHLGNLSPDEHERDGLLKRVQEVDDAGPILREFALRADRETEGTRWSYYRDLGDSRLVVIDSRCGRALEEGRRSMLDEDEWDWVAEHATGDFDHLLIATSLPWLMAPGMHHLEAWNEAVCGGAWGPLAARLGEKLRQGLDLEHWAAFNESFDRLAELQRAVGAGERGEPPASIVTLSGDVHHAYLSEVAFRRGSGVRSAVYQATCSPLRNPLDTKERRVVKAAVSTPAYAVTRALSRAAGVEGEPVRWRGVGDGPWFDNQVATLELDGRRMDFKIEKALPGEGEGGDPELECVLEHRIS
ncbi:MAG: alkaline phosphatase D family protein [Thermoleophilaceae bacterium]|nr:alkaline phosphatase D family protein [Thermoleophilaceae bacterium]